MKILIDAEPKEIAALVTAIQERHHEYEHYECELNVDPKEFAKAIHDKLQECPMS